MAKRKRRRKRSWKKDFKLSLWVGAVLFAALLLEQYGPVLLWIPAALAALYAALFKVLPWYLRLRRHRRANIKAVDRMNGEEFEAYLAFMFRRLGYKAEVTRQSGDFGADLILEKDGRKTVVQAKRYTGKVALDAVQEVVTSMKMYEADEAMVVTNSFFTDPAVKLAAANGVALWDRTRLITEMSRINMRAAGAPEEEPAQTAT